MRHRLAHDVYRLFTIGLGRPSMICERDITAPKPALLKEEEFVPWKTNEGELPTEAPASRCVTTMRYITTIFQLACPALDEMYVILVLYSELTLNTQIRPE